MVGTELRDKRKHLKLTQEGLAKHLGVAANTVARWERDELAIPEYLALALEGLEFRFSKIKKAD